MQFLTINQAAQRLGRDQSAVYSMVRAGRMKNLTEGRTGPALIASGDVQRVAFELRHKALSRVDELELAQRVRAILWPEEQVIVRADGRPDADSMGHAMNRVKGRSAIRLLPPEATDVFGVDVIDAAATTVQAGVCRTCWSRMSAAVHESTGPKNTPPYRELLGSPCPADVTAWAATDREARQKMQRLTHDQRARHDAEQAERIIREYQEASRAVHAATAAFAAANKARKARGLPVPGRKRTR